MRATGALKSFFSELRRRRVLRFAGGYLAASFFVLQGADYLMRALLLPDWVFRVVVLVALVGLVAALPLAWIYDLGPHGLSRTPELDARAGGPSHRGLWVAFVVTALALVGAGVWLVLRGGASTVHPRRLVVAPFENRTGDASLAPLGEMAADWIAQGLTESGVVEVADGSAVLAIARTGSSQQGITAQDLVQRFSQATGAGLVVTGRYYGQGDSVAFLAQVVDARSGKLLRAVGPVAVARTAPVAGAEQLRRRLLAELAVMLDERLARFQPLDGTPPAYEAYGEFIEGLHHEVADEWRDAEVHFTRAYDLDSTFHRALLLAAGAALMVGPMERYDSLAARVDRIRDQLSLPERYQLDARNALRRGDHRAEYAAVRRYAEAVPGSDYAVWNLALAAGRVHRYRESLALLRRIDPERGLSRWKWYWAYVAGARHAVGDFRRELRAAEALARQLPGSPAPPALRLSALAALGHTDEARSLAFTLAERLATDTLGARELSNVETLGFPVPAAPVPLWLAARELGAHGHRQEARALVEDALRWCAARAPRERADPGFRLVRAHLLGLAGRWRDAANALAAPAPPEWDYAYSSYRGVVAARLGDRARALAIARGLSHLDPNVLELNRVTIIAALGQRDEALRRLRDLAAAGGDFGAWWLHTEPALAPYLEDGEVRRFLRSRD